MPRTEGARGGLRRKTEANRGEAVLQVRQRLPRREEMRSARDRRDNRAIQGRGQEKQQVRAGRRLTPALFVFFYYQIGGNFLCKN